MMTTKIAYQRVHILPKVCQEQPSVSNVVHEYQRKKSPAVENGMKYTNMQEWIDKARRDATPCTDAKSCIIEVDGECRQYDDDGYNEKCRNLFNFSLIHFLLPLQTIIFALPGDM